ncbi:aminotransferase class I/II-fold pyridoxal phosphate-dependent enzyme, partial [Acidomonas methanolica]|uniref:aminotransferase class I/II-fold pyridoxal phosphate-dependent enzyme n=1 Tax=Acidomonas methanolica TaxID=437 RepID=UPI00223009F7
CACVRSFASGFIFPPALPPMVAAGALASIRYLRASQEERRLHKDRVAYLRARLDEAGIPHLVNPSHIVPVMVGEAVRCRGLSDELLARFGHYIQPINYPTVARGTERLRITPGPLHSRADIDDLVGALATLWKEQGMAAAAA